MARAATISNLPAELLLRVTEDLPFDDIRSLSSVNSQFRALLAPALFEGLRATNLDDDQAILEQVVQQHGQHVHKLSFELYLYPNADDIDHSADDAPEQRTLPDCTEALLRGTSLPGLDTITVSFWPWEEFGGEDGWQSDCSFCDGGSIYIHEKEEHETDDVVEAEAEFLWRFIVTRALTAIASNGKIRKLKLSRLIPRLFTAYFTEEWRGFLGRLQECEVDLWAGDNGVGWQSNSLPGYFTFVTSLQQYYFRHLTSARRVRFASLPDDPVGADHVNETSMPLGAHDLPSIRELELVHCIIDEALLVFLKAKAQSLASLQLLNCHSAGLLDWAEFFAALHAAKPVLSELIVRNNRVPLCNRELYWDDDEDGPFVPSENEESNTANVRRELQLCPRRQLFSYIEVDSGWGCMWPKEEENLRAFVHGKDQEKFDALRQWIGENRQQALNDR